MVVIRLTRRPTPSRTELTDVPSTRSLGKIDRASSGERAGERGRGAGRGARGGTHPAGGRGGRAARPRGRVRSRNNGAYSSLTMSFQKYN